MNPAVIAAVVLGLVLVIVIAAVSAAQAKVVNLNKYAKIEITGYDGYGEARLVFDTDGITKDYGKKMQGTVSYFTDYFDPGEMFRSDCVDGSFDRESGLKNGDRISFRWKCRDGFAEQHYGLKLKYKDMRVTVKGLDKVDSFDPFSDLSVSFSGYNGYGSAEFENGARSGPASELLFYTDAGDLLSNGDIVTVSVQTGWYDAGEFAKRMLDTYGVVPASLSREYTVSGLEEGQKVNLFDHIKVSISGVSGDAGISVEIDRSQPYMQNIIARADREWPLSSGDVITLSLYGRSYDTARLGAELARKFGVIPERVEKKYIISELDEYITDASQISASSLETICAQMNDIITANFAGMGTGVVLDSAEYVGCYVLTKKDFSYRADANYLIPVYHVSGYTYNTNLTSANSFSYYYTITYANVSADSSGNCTLGNYSSHNALLNIGGISIFSSIWGFMDLNELYSRLVASELENYTFSSVGGVYA